MNRKMMTLCLAIGLVANMPMVRAQQKEGPVMISITVVDSAGSPVRNLGPKDFRISEDGVTQKIASFAEGGKPPVELLDDGTIRPLGLEEWTKQTSGSTASEDSYAVVYYPQPNTSQGYRRISVEITSDPGKSYRVRYRAGYYNRAKV